MNGRQDGEVVIRAPGKEPSMTIWANGVMQGRPIPLKDYTRPNAKAEGSGAAVIQAA